MDDLAIIDRFTETFSRYIDSGFGLLSGDVAFLTSVLVAIDITLAGLFWALMGEDNVPAQLKGLGDGADGQRSHAGGVRGVGGIRGGEAAAGEGRRAHRHHHVLLQLRDHRRSVAG
jgi:hypothetical protein